MTKVRRAPFVGAIIALSVVIGLLGCQAQSAAPIPTQAAAPPTRAAAAPTPVAAAPTQAVAAAPEVIKVGISAGLSGAGARSQIANERYVRYGIDDVNAKGGFKVGGKTYRFEGITADDKSTSEGGLDAANRLVLGEKVKFILGMSSSPLATAQAITEANKVIVLSVYTLDKSLGPNYPFTFAIALSTPMRQAAIYDWFKQEFPNAKRLATVMADDTTNRTVFDSAAQRISENGLTLVAKEFFPLDIKDTSPLVTRVLREKPDAIDFGGIGGKGTVLLGMAKALQEQGFKGPMISTSADVAVMRDGAALLEGFATAQISDIKSPLLTSGERAIIDRFVAQYSQGDLDTAALMSYNTPMLLAQAMEKAGTVSDTEKIAATLRAGEWDTMWSKEIGKSRFSGAKTFGVPAILEQPIYLSRVQDGKLDTFKVIKGTLP